MAWPRLASPSFLAVLLCVLVGLSSVSARAAQGQSPVPAPRSEADLDPPRSGPVLPIRESARIFWSGHSLTDNPLPDYVERIAESLGSSIRWNQQNIPGSAIERRTRGDAAAGVAWAGYRQGKNREGEGMDVVAELREPRTLGGDRYDTLILTEGHWMLYSLISEHTIRYLRHFHERLIEGNPQGTTLFYESWLDIRDKGDPSDWIAYEREASEMWQCMATRVNRSVAAQGRNDRIVSLPTGAALAHLLESATGPAGLPGLTQSNVRQTVDLIFKDDVHLTELGIYYAALVTYAATYQRSPLGAWVPPGVVSAGLADELQQLVWDFVRGYYAGYRPLGLADCTQRMALSFCDHHHRYMHDTYWGLPSSYYWRGAAEAELIRQRDTEQCRYIHTHPTRENPFHYKATDDPAFWFPSP